MNTSEEQDAADDFFEHYRIEADPGQNPLRVDKFLMVRIMNASRNRIQNAAKRGYVLVNDEAVKPNYKVKAGDKVSLVLPHPPRDKELIPENIPLDLVYEDEFLIVVNKPPGMVVHPGYGNYSGTLVNAVAYHFGQGGLPSMDKEAQRPGLVHRIDKDTSGLLILAKTEETMTHLANQFFHHSIDRTYEALIWGEPAEDEGTIENYLRRNPRDRKQMWVAPDEEDAKWACTHYKVLERFGFASRIECTLETGRTHQIRIHMKHLGHPILNDSLYGGDHIRSGLSMNRFKTFIENTFKIMPRQALHARTLGFEHPDSGKRLRFEQPLHPDMLEALNRIRSFHEQYGKL